jgi:hypothetical protein
MSTPTLTPHLTADHVEELLEDGCKLVAYRDYVRVTDSRGDVTYWCHRSPIMNIGEGGSRWAYGRYFFATLREAAAFIAARRA